MPATTRGRLGQRLGQHAAGLRRIDLGVDDTDLDRAVHTAGDPLVLEREFLVQGVALVIGAAASFFLCRMPTAALAPMTATSASGQANTLVAFSDREFIAM